MMKRRIFSLLLALCMVFSLLPATALAAEETAVTVQITGTEDYLASAKVHDQINDLRAENGLQPLERSQALTEAAMQRAAEIALYYNEDHLRPDDREAETVLEGVYSDYTAWGENILITSASTYEVLAELIASEPHNENLLDKNYTQMGVGCFVSGGYFCWVQLFGNSITDADTTNNTQMEKNAVRSVDVLPSRVVTHPDGEWPTTIFMLGHSSNLNIYARNQGFPGCNPSLMLLVEDYVELRDSEGTLVATVYRDSFDPGRLCARAEAKGAVSIKIPVYKGQENPVVWKIKVDVNDGSTTPSIYPDENAYDTGTWGENLTWTLEGTTLTVSGEGEMASEVYNEATYPWRQYRDAVTRVVIAPGVTSLNDSAFSRFSILETVELPDTLESMGASAFYRCNTLKSIEMPDSVTSIGEHIFNRCTSLESVRLSENLETIPSWAFYETPITELEIPDSVTYIGKEAFRGSKLTRLEIPGSVTEIDHFAFYLCKDVTELVLSEGLTRLGDAVFGHGRFTEVELPESLEYMGAEVFSACTELRSIAIPDHFTELPKGFLSACTSLETVDLPQGLTELPKSFFAGCTALQYVDIPESVTSVGEYCFERCINLRELVLPEAITKISSGCFQYSGIETIELPEGLEYIDNWAFRNCAALSELTIPAGTRLVDTAFEGCYNLVLGVYEMSQAHLEVMESELLYRIVPEDPDTAFYPILVYNNAGGTVEISREESPADRYVWLTVTPDEGYSIESIYYMTADGSELEGLKSEGNTIEFLMPECAVAFEVSFINMELPFVDVDERAYYYVPVAWALNHGITTGTDSTHFSPDAACTRGQVVTFLWRAAGCPEPTITENPFVDVKESAFYYKAVLWAVENGITSGVDSKHFAPNAGCTRGQVVTFLWRACGKPETDTSENWFVDVKENAYYTEAVLWAALNGITTGVSSTHFFPDNVCTRGQIVTFLFRTFYG